jgi:hypothetical protein
MKLFLKVLFIAIFVSMVVMTLWVQTHKSILLSPNEFTWQSSPWACATLVDAYFGFTTFFVWVCYKEPGIARKVLWFVLIMGLGNIAMSFYVLLQLFKLNHEEPAWAALTKRA